MASQNIVPKHGSQVYKSQNFPRHAYGKRSLVESVFSAIKRKLSCRAPCRSFRTQALLLGLATYLYRFRPRAEISMSTEATDF